MYVGSRNWRVNRTAQENIGETYSEVFKSSNLWERFLDGNPENASQSQRYIETQMQAMCSCKHTFDAWHSGKLALPI